MQQPGLQKTFGPSAALSPDVGEGAHMSDRSVSTSPLSCSPLSWSPPDAAPGRVATRTDDAEVTHLGTLYLRIGGPIYASAARGLIALCWLDLGVTGVFATRAAWVCAY